MINAIAVDDEPLALKVIESCCSQCSFINLQKTFTQPNEALAYLRKFPADLLFVDIHMPGMTGLNLVKALSQDTMVIFTTAFSEYAAASYELNAIEYLLKPINQKRFTQAVNKAHDYFKFKHKQHQETEKYLYIRADFSLVKIPVAEILYIEGLADYLKIHIRDRKTVVTRMPMKDIMEKLPPGEFIRVHRSYILPFKNIESIKGTTIFMGEQQFPLGKTYVDDFLKRYSG